MSCARSWMSCGRAADPAARCTGMRAASALAASAILGLTVWARPAAAARIESLRVVQDQGGYAVALDATLAAPRQRVFAVLSDFAHLQRINPEIIAASAARSPAGSGTRVRTVLHSCVLFFCRNLVQVEDVTRRPEDSISTRIVPGTGDFASGWSVWRLAGDGQITRVHYEARRKVGFWVPPLVSAMAVRHGIGERLKVSLQSVEQLANHAP